MPLPLSQDIAEYIQRHSSPEPEVLQAIAKVTRSHTKSPEMMCGHIEGLFLRLMTRAVGARRALEIGTFTGYSALSIAEGLAEDGELITCDIDPESTAIARQHWDDSPHGGKITLKLGPALATVRSLEGPFDLVFIDADKPGYIDYWDACVPKLRRGGVVLADNTLWEGHVVEPDSDNARAIARFNEHIARDQRVERVILPVRDGITLAVRL